jgi:hypothetical protein
MREGRSRIARSLSSGGASRRAVGSIRATGQVCRVGKIACFAWRLDAALMAILPTRQTDRSYAWAPRSAPLPTLRIGRYTRRLGITRIAFSLSIALMSSGLNL